MNWPLAIAVVIVWLGIAPFADEMTTFYRTSYETAAEKARQIEEEMKDELVFEQARSYCWQVAGESVPVFDKQGQVIRCDPRRKS